MTWVLCGAIWIGFVLAHCYYLSSVESILEDGDAGVYYKNSIQSLTSEEFWKGVVHERPNFPPVSRPPGVLLFWKFFSSYASYENAFTHEETGKRLIDDARLLWAHTLLCIVAWTSLALACARTAYNSKIRPILFACPLVMSLFPQVAMWNFIARSESFSLSLFVIFIAFWISFLRSRHVIYLAAIAIVAMFWAGARETNAYVLAMIAIVLIGTVIYKGGGTLHYRISKSMLLLAVWFIAMFATANTLMDMGDRWKFPFFNVMGKRILGVSDHVEYFRNHGMPINEALREREGKWASDDNWAFYTDPGLEEFRAWSNLHGKATYMKFLLSHPVYSITAPFKHYFRELKRFEKKWYKGYTHPDFQPLITFRIPAPVIQAFPPIQYTGAFLVLPGAGIFCLAVRRYGWGFCCSRAAVPVTMILLSIPHAWLTWHGDAMEIHRHSFLAIFQLHLGSVLLGLFAWDMLLDRKMENSEDHE